MSSVYDDLFGAVSAVLAAYSYKLNGHTGEDEDMDGEVDFWLDPEAVIFETSPNYNEVSCGEYKDLFHKDSFASEFLSQDIARTYLSSREIAVILGRDEDTLMLALVDRSNGTALIKPSHIFDEKALEAAKQVAQANASTEVPSPMNVGYRFVVPQDSKLTTAQRDNAKRRLINMMSEIDIYVLSQYAGHEIKVREDL